MINIANLSQLLQSNNPEVLQGIINKIENLSESGGKTFEEVLQEVFSQLNSEIQESNNTNNTKESKLDKYTETSIEEKQKLERLNHNKFQQNSEKDINVKQDNLEYSAELTKRTEQENETEQISNLQAQPSQKEKNLDKLMQKIEINNLDKNKSKENGATQVIQQLYAQKVYKNNAASKDSLDDNLSEKNIISQDENISDSEQLNQEIEKPKNSIQDKQISIRNSNKEKINIQIQTQKTEQEMDFSFENPSELKESKKEVENLVISKQHKLTSSNNSESRKEEEPIPNKFQNISVQKEKTTDKTNVQRINLVNIDKDNLKVSESTQQPQQSHMQNMQKLYKNPNTIDDKLSTKKFVSTEIGTTDIRYGASSEKMTEQMTEQLRKTSSNSPKTENTLSNKETNLQRNSFKDDTVKYTFVKQQDSKNVDIKSSNQSSVGNTVNTGQKSVNPDGIVSNPLNVTLPRDKNNQIKQNQGPYVNISNVERGNNVNISENNELLEYLKIPNKNNLNSQLKTSNFEKDSINKNVKIGSNIQQKLEQSNNNPEKIFNSVSENKVKSPEFFGLEKIVSKVNTSTPTNSISTKDDKEKQFNENIKQDVNLVSNSYARSVENISFIQQIVGIKQLGNSLSYLITTSTKLEQINSSGTEIQKLSIANSKNSFRETNFSITERTNQKANGTNTHTRNILNVLNEITLKLYSAIQEDTPKQIADNGNGTLQDGKLSEFVKEIRIFSELNMLTNYNMSESKTKKNDKSIVQTLNTDGKDIKDINDKALHQTQSVIVQNQVNELNNLNYTIEQNEQTQRNFSGFSQNSYQEIYTDNTQAELRKSATESSKNNLEVKSFQIEYKEKRDIDSEKYNISPEDKPKISNKFVERLAELTYKGAEQKIEIQSNVQTGRYELAERLQASRNLEQIYERIKEFTMLNKVEERVQMKLVPESLGNLDVEMKKEGRQLVLFFAAESEKAKEVIEKNIHVLRERLSNLDLDVRNIEVKVKEEEKYYEHERNHQHPNQHGQNHHENKKKYTHEEVNQDDDERKRNV